MFKRKIACVFLLFAGFMLLVHAVLPHHHHCQHVVFFKACAQKSIMAWQSDTAGLSSSEKSDITTLPIQGILDKSHIPGCQSGSHSGNPYQEDPCWKNVHYVVGKIIQNYLPEIVSLPPSFLFKDHSSSVSESTPWDFFKKNRWGKTDFLLTYKGFHPLTDGLRSPPVF